jgi:hypothetical protein
LLLRRIKAYLKPALADFLYFFTGKADCAPGLKDMECKILVRPTALRKNFLEQTSFQQQLGNHMRHLQQEVENLKRIHVFTICVFQPIYSVLLHIKPLVLDFPSIPPSQIGKLHRVVFTHFLAYEPFELRCFLLPFDWFSFQTLQDGQSMVPPVGVNIVNVISQRHSCGIFPRSGPICHLSEKKIGSRRTAQLLRSDDMEDAVVIAFFISQNHLKMASLQCSSA